MCSLHAHPHIIVLILCTKLLALNYIHACMSLVEWSAALLFVELSQPLCCNITIILCIPANSKPCRNPDQRIYIKTSGSESRPRKVELASTHKKAINIYREYFTHNNEACKNPYKTTLPH